uniref:NAD(P)-dependent alcohol dehydrogenase n=1 Tax=uncultured Thiotrichaceae bacterium TaxID=298394 RepID=A0A6S6SWY3_9GAMM|nr:MAG: NAD(P)-dependent alcohol dehydrogenase [uncultured Thiotrichaceae bacterium]
MKAVAWTKYGKPGDALKIIEKEKPKPNKVEVLIKVHASTVTAGDVRLRACKVPAGFWLLTRLAFGVFKPRKTIPGMDFSGEVEAVGKGVTLFNIGDTVYGTSGMHLGANAEYICLPEKAAFIKKPEKISHNDAVASLFGGQTAIHFLKEKAKLVAGQKILINGASGSVGTASVQLAKYLGAEVTGVCSTGNIELIKSLGADKTIDYTKGSIEIAEEAYDIVLDNVGNLSVSRCNKLLKKNGKLISINAGLLTNLSAILNKNLISGVAGESKKNIEFLKKLTETGNMRSVIDKIYPLEQIVEAHKYVDKGHKKGNVVISVTHAPNAGYYSSKEAKTCHKVTM